MDWNEEDDDWVNDDVLANIDSIVAQHQSKQQLASQLPSSPENQRPSAVVLPSAPAAAANGHHHVSGPAAPPPQQAQARSLGLPPAAARGHAQPQPWQQPLLPQQQWGHQPLQGAIPMTSSFPGGKPSDPLGRPPLQRLPVHRSLGQQLASHPGSAAAGVDATAAAAAKAATNPHPHHQHHQQVWGQPAQQAAHSYQHHLHHQHQQHQQPQRSLAPPPPPPPPPQQQQQQWNQPASELPSAPVVLGSGIGSLILAELSQPMPSALAAASVPMPSAAVAGPGPAAIAAAAVPSADVAMSEAGVLPSSAAPPLLGELERLQREARAARQANEELRLRAERAERLHQQLQHQQPSQSLQAEHQRQLDALQQQLMFATEELAGNRRRASERESRLSESQGRVGTLERDLRRREEQLVQLEEELRLARERLPSPAFKQHQNPSRASGSQGGATAPPHATPQRPHAAGGSAHSAPDEEDMGTMDAEPLHRSTLPMEPASNATPGQPGGGRLGFAGGGGALAAPWASQLQSLLSTAYLWQPSIWQQLWSACPAELACFVVGPGHRADGVAGAAGAGNEDGPAAGPPAASSLPETVSAAHSRVSQALTVLSRHCTSADAATVCPSTSHPAGPTSSSGPRPMHSSPLGPQPLDGTRPQAATLVLQELLCLMAALLRAGAAEPSAGAAVRSELLSALGLLAGLIRLSGLSAASCAPSSKRSLDSYCLLSAPDVSSSTGAGSSPPGSPANLLDRLGLAALELLTLLHRSQLPGGEGMPQRRGSRRGSEDDGGGGPSSPGALLLRSLGGALAEVLTTLLSPARVQEVAPSVLQSDLLHDLLCSPLPGHSMLGLRALQLLLHRSPLARSELQQASAGGTGAGGEELALSLQAPSSADRLRQLAAGVLECLCLPTSPECGPPVTSRSWGAYSLQRRALALLAEMLEQGQEAELAALCCAPWLPLSSGLAQRLLQLADVALRVPGDLPSAAGGPLLVAPLPERCRLAQEALLLLKAMLLGGEELRSSTLQDLTSDSEAVSLLFCATSRLASVRDSWRDLHLPPGIPQQHAWPEVLLAPWAQRLLRSTVVAGRGQPLAAGTQAGCGLEAVVALNSSITRRSLHRLQHTQLAAQAAELEQNEQQQRQQARAPAQ